MTSKLDSNPRWGGMVFLDARVGDGANHAIARFALALVALVGWGVFGSAPAAHAEVKSTETGGFAITHVLTLPGTPESIYDTITGDLGPWWDHKFSKSPHAFFIEPWAGGGFYELFDADGNGVRHASVIWAERGKRLRFEGPLGLSGNGIVFVSTYDLSAVGDSTRIAFSASAAGKFDPSWPGVVDGVWKHFLFEALKPYVESGKNRGRTPWTRQRSAALLMKNE